MPTASRPENLWLDWTQRWVDESIRNFNRASRLPFLYQKSQDVKKGCTPSEVVYEQDQIKLLRYTTEEPVKYKTPMLFVFALVNRPYILDLKPGKSVVEHYVRAGFDTYLIDWGAPTDADRHLSLDDYVNGFMLNVVNHLR